MISRDRSRAAAGRTSTSASDCAGSRLTSATVPTGYPAGKPPPSPDVTSKSPDDHVGAGRKVGQLQPAGVAGAHGDGAQPVAVDLDGNGVRGIADQDDFAGELLDPRDLAEHAARIEHRLTDEYAVMGALVDQHPLAKGIEVDVHDVADHEAASTTSVVLLRNARNLAVSASRAS